METKTLGKKLEKLSKASNYPEIAVAIFDYIDSFLQFISGKEICFDENPIKELQIHISNTAALSDLSLMYAFALEIQKVEDNFIEDIFKTFSFKNDKEEIIKISSEAFQEATGTNLGLTFSSRKWNLFFSLKEIKNKLAFEKIKKLETQNINLVKRIDRIEKFHKKILFVASGIGILILGIITMLNF